MSNTTFKNSNGLTESGHMSTARDMATLTLAIRRDFPEFWNLFGRRNTHVGIKTATHSGLRLLDACQGIEAVKIGKTRAAGYNAVAVASQQGKSILVVIFGSRSSVELRDKLSNLCELGFSRASSGPAVAE